MEEEKTQDGKKRTKGLKRTMMAGWILLAATAFVCMLSGFALGRMPDEDAAVCPPCDDTAVEVEVTRIVGVAPVVSEEPVTTVEPTRPVDKHLTVRDIENAKSDLTKLQWNIKRAEFAGQTIEFSGSVVQVYNDGRVLTSEGKLLTAVVLVGISMDTLVKLDQGHALRGIGTVQEVSDLVGLSIRIDVTKLY